MRHAERVRASHQASGVASSSSNSVVAEASCSVSHTALKSSGEKFMAMPSTSFASDPVTISANDGLGPFALQVRHQGQRCGLVFAIHQQQRILTQRFMQLLWHNPR